MLTTGKPFRTRKGRKDIVYLTQKCSKTAGVKMLQSCRSIYKPEAGEKKNDKIKAPGS